MTTSKNLHLLRQKFHQINQLFMTKISAEKSDNCYRTLMNTNLHTFTQINGPDKQTRIFEVIYSGGRKHVTRWRHLLKNSTHLSTREYFIPSGPCTFNHFVCCVGLVVISTLSVHRSHCFVSFVVDCVLASVVQWWLEIEQGELVNLGAGVSSQEANERHYLLLPANLESQSQSWLAW